MHTGHRQRMRERIAANGLNSLADYEVIEYLLYFVQPRVNVNDTAHRLIRTFGDMNGVFNATPVQLSRIDGIGEISAQFLTLLPDLFQRYWENSNKEKKNLISLGGIIEEFQGLFLGARVEKLAAIYLNGEREYIASEVLAVGSRHSVHIQPKVLLGSAIRYDATFVVLGHNHPYNIAKPSDADRELTKTLKHALDCIGVSMMDHLILCPNGSYYSFLSEPAFEQGYAF